MTGKPDRIRFPAYQESPSGKEQVWRRIGGHPHDAEFHQELPRIIALTGYIVSSERSPNLTQGLGLILTTQGLQLGRTSTPVASALRLAGEYE